MIKLTKTKLIFAAPNGEKKVTSIVQMDLTKYKDPNAAFTKLQDFLHSENFARSNHLELYFNNFYGTASHTDDYRNICGIIQMVILQSHQITGAPLSLDFHITPSGEYPHVATNLLITPHADLNIVARRQKLMTHGNCEDYDVDVAGFVLKAGGDEADVVLVDQHMLEQAKSLRSTEVIFKTSKKSTLLEIDLNRYSDPLAVLQSIREVFKTQAFADSPFLEYARGNTAWYAMYDGALKDFYWVNPAFTCGEILSTTVYTNDFGVPNYVVFEVSAPSGKALDIFSAASKSDVHTVQPVWKTDVFGNKRIVKFTTLPRGHVIDVRIGGECSFANAK